MIDDEQATGTLLHLAGARPDPSDARTARVRAAVLAEWRAAHRRRRRQRITAITGLCATAAIALLFVWVRLPIARTPLAVVQRIPTTGALTARRGSTPVTLAARAPLFANDLITTAGGQRASIQTSDGSFVRIDEQSRVRLLNATVIEVVSGAVYIATAPGSHGFEVRTSMGTLRDLGTQFEVRLGEGALRLRVRSGMVEVNRQSGTRTVGADMEAEIRGDAMTLRAMVASAAEWAWTTEPTPSFDIEGQPLQRFLEQLATERGWRITYADDPARDAARASILHGSVAGLSADDALGVVLGASGLTYQLRGTDLVISRADTTH